MTQQRAWKHVVDDPAARHLVAARLVPKATDEPATLLASLIDGLGPVGEFALLTRCGEECAVVLCAFTHPDDARALAAAMEAMTTDEFPDWGSSAIFTLDRAAAQGIVDALEATMPPAVGPEMALSAPA